MRDEDLDDLMGVKIECIYAVTFNIRRGLSYQPPEVVLGNDIDYETMFYDLDIFLPAHRFEQRAFNFLPRYILVMKNSKL